MENKTQRNGESSPEEINSFYEMLKNRKITESDVLIRVGTAEAAEKSYSGNLPKNATPRESGDHGPDDRKLRSTPENKTDKSVEEIDDGCIKIHSLSSNASILVPETHRPDQQVKEKILKYENNFVRPRTALTNVTLRKVGTNPTSRRQVKTALNENKSKTIQGNAALNPSAHRSTSTAVASMSLSPVCSSSSSSYEYNTSDSQKTLADEQKNGSVRPDTRDSRHAIVIPMETGVSAAPSDYSIRPGTASSEVVHRAFTRIDDEKIQALQQIFQLIEPSYNEWREGMEDPTDNSRKLKELVEKLYLRERRETAKDRAEYYVYNVLLGRIVELLDDFALLPVPLGFQVRCRVTRRRSGVDGTLFPQYFLHLQRYGEPDVLLLTAKKHKPLSTSYVISSDPADLSSKSPHCVGILKANLRGKQFNLYTKDKSNVLDLSSESGTSTKPSTAASMRSDNKIKEDREQLLELSYESNPLGFKGPRRIKVKIPKFQSDHQRAYAGSFKKKGNPLLVELANRDPVWSPQSNSFILNFRGRVQLASVKNFQIIHPDMALHNLLQFGRVDKADTFILDFGYPFCPLQAFAIGLSSFDVKWGLE